MNRLMLLPATLVAAFFAATSFGAPGGPGRAPLDVYTVELAAGEVGDLVREGFDVSAARTVNAQTEVDLVLTAAQQSRLEKRGLEVRLKRNKDGKTARQAAAEQAAAGFSVWRSWDESGGIQDELRALARDNPQLVKLVTLARTHQGREILGLKLTQGARGTPDGTRPAVLYSSLQHAREWISVEVNRRLLRWYVDRWRANDTEVKRLLKDTELWFIVVANPDGYQYTFDVERLWRKNLRDNDGDGQTTILDGVDPNRNYPEHWRYDEEGSSSLQSSETYRGPAAGSEPETQAVMGLYARVPFRFHVNYHSAGQWLLYPEGWQIGTPSADDPIYFALSGNLDRPAIADFQPGLSSDVLYVTNGETTDWAYSTRGSLAWTPELSEGCVGCGFVFPDDDALVQAEFERNLPFAHSVARSVEDPDDPKSVLGTTTKPFYLRSDDTYKAGLPGANFTFETSYGDPQPVQVLAKRSLGVVMLKFRVNGGAVRSAPTAEWAGGERYGGPGFYYHVVRGAVTGTAPGDSVEVWFEGGGARSESFTYTAVAESGRRVLVVSAEDYSGASPAQAPGPHYLQYYLDALAANGTAADVYDVDARGRRAPDHLGVLSHYDSVIWYTGNDVVTRKLGWAAGNADRIAMDELLQFRAYMNEGGRVVFTGKNAGSQYSQALGTQLYDPTAANAQCRADPAVARRCIALFGSGDAMNDVLQYWLGAYLLNAGAGVDPDTGEVFDVDGVADPLDGISWSLNGPDSADNQDNANSFIAASGILPLSTFPQFESWAAAKYDRPGGPFAPHTGDRYLWSQIADVSYKRLVRTMNVPAGGGSLTFWTSYDTELHWDHLFVEAHTVGQDDWTTLPDANAHTSQDTGESCPAGWHDLHPWLERYQTLNPDGTCSPHGTAGNGQWHASSGNSGGWQQWRIDLSAYAGRQIEVSISYASDWAIQGLGVFVDDVTLPDGTSTSFETGLDGWTIAGPPPGSGPNGNDFIRANADSFPEGAVVATPSSVYFGHGIEGIAGAPTRAAVLGRALGN